MRIPRELKKQLLMTHSLAIEINTNSNNDSTESMDAIHVSVSVSDKSQIVFIHPGLGTTESITIWFGLLEDGLIVDHDEEFKQLHNKLMLIAEEVSK